MGTADVARPVHDILRALHGEVWVLDGKGEAHHAEGAAFTRGGKNIKHAMFVGLKSINPYNLIRPMPVGKWSG